MGTLQTRKSDHTRGNLLRPGTLSRSGNLYMLGNSIKPGNLLIPGTFFKPGNLLIPGNFLKSGNLQGNLYQEVSSDQVISSG